MTSDYLQTLRGKFTGIMRWEDLDHLWQRVQQDNPGWYLYDTTGSPPDAPLDASTLANRLHTIREDLRQRHRHDYCGIVYADNPAKPAFIKVYDPDNLGVVCGYSDNPPPPRWILSHMPAETLPVRKPSPGGWRRWLPGKH